MSNEHIDLKPSEVDVVIYHSPCTDGYVSSFVAYWFNKTILFDMKKLKFIPYNHANKMTVDSIIEFVKDKNVLMCDCSFKREDSLRMIDITNKFLIIDHHKTAEEGLKDIPNENKIFNMDYSGAYLTWKYYFPHSEVPLFIQYVSDYDTFKKVLPKTTEFTAYIYTIPFPKDELFTEYEKMMNEEYVHSIIEIGSGMIYQNNYYIMDAVDKADLIFTLIDGEPYFYGNTNSTVQKSEVGSQMFKKYPLLDFSCCYLFENGKTLFSLRSTDSRTDVSHIAKLCGGGGHRN